MKMEIGCQICKTLLAPMLPTTSVLIVKMWDLVSLYISWSMSSGRE